MNLACSYLARPVLSALQHLAVIDRPVRRSCFVVLTARPRSHRLFNLPLGVDQIRRKSDGER
jgi:hypothetical protein